MPVAGAATTPWPDAGPNAVQVDGHRTELLPQGRRIPLSSREVALRFHPRFLGGREPDWGWRKRLPEITAIPDGAAGEVGVAMLALA